MYNFYNLIKRHKYWFKLKRVWGINWGRRRECDSIKISEKNRGKPPLSSTPPPPPRYAFSSFYIYNINLEVVFSIYFMFGGSILSFILGFTAALLFPFCCIAHMFDCYLCDVSVCPLLRDERRNKRRLNSQKIYWFFWLIF